MTRIPILFHFDEKLVKERNGTTCIINWFFYLNIGSHNSHSLWHTWCNYQARSNKIFKHLDRAMISAQSFFSFAKFSPLLVKLLVDVTFSYHFPIIFCIEWELRHPRASRNQVFLNTSLLSHQPTLAHINTIWNLECMP